MVLSAVEGAGGRLAPGEIAERLIVTSASVTSLLDTLEKRGFVRRTAHPDDRRKVIVEITPAGQAVVDRLLPGLHAMEREAMAVLTVAEQRTLLELLAKLQVSFADLAARPPEPLGGRRNKPKRLARP
jgi:DNA-binding MarR family transcriptional regulator